MTSSRSTNSGLNVGESGAENKSLLSPKLGKEDIDSAGERRVHLSFSHKLEREVLAMSRVNANVSIIM